MAEKSSKRARRISLTSAYVKMTRKKWGLTQEELAKLCGVRPVTVSRCETGSGSLKSPSVMATITAIDRVLTRRPESVNLVLSFLRAEAGRGGLSVLLEDLLEEWIRSREKVD